MSSIYVWSWELNKLQEKFLKFLVIRFEIGVDGGRVLANHFFRLVHFAEASLKIK